MYTYQLTLTKINICKKYMTPSIVELLTKQPVRSIVSNLI